jgi:hypothetical protein
MPSQFAAETAAISGQSKQDINRHLSRAEVLGDDLQAVAGTSLDKGVELDALKTLPAPERKQLIERAAAVLASYLQRRVQSAHMFPCSGFSPNSTARVDTSLTR